MGGIDDRHVEWAVVNRLKKMLDAPPKTRFNVTQSFALFNAILLWSKNRAWVAGKEEGRPAWFDAADHAAHDARESYGQQVYLMHLGHFRNLFPASSEVTRAVHSTMRPNESTSTLKR
jgi:hypothetical protein